MQLSGRGHQPLLAVGDRCGPMVRARQGHGRRGRREWERGGDDSSSTTGRGLFSVATDLVGKRLHDALQHCGVLVTGGVIYESFVRAAGVFSPVLGV
jgi:hypothetical protein